MKILLLILPVSVLILLSCSQKGHTDAYSGNGPFNGTGGGSGSGMGTDNGSGSGPVIPAGTITTRGISEGIYIQEQIPVKRMIPYETVSQGDQKASEEKIAVRRMYPNSAVSEADEMYMEQQGIVTAAELNDLGNWELWKDIRESELKQYESIWKLKYSKRFTVLAQGKSKCPLANVTISLKSQGKTIWESQTDNKGLAQVWLSDSTQQELTIECRSGKEQKLINRPVPFEQGINLVAFDADVIAANEIDIVFAVDATSSMVDEISFLKADLMSIILDVQAKNPGSDIHLGSVFYQCKGSGNDYVTVNSDLTSDFGKTLDFIRDKYATGGGDEVVHLALDEAVNKLAWRSTARTKLVFILLDEPPSATDESTKKWRGSMPTRPQKE